MLICYPIPNYPTNHLSQRLYFAAEAGDTEALNTILQESVNINARGENQNTPLHASAAQDKPNTLTILLSKGLQPHMGTYLSDLRGKYNIYQQYGQYRTPCCLC